jgi:WD40 repeat protein
MAGRPERPVDPNEGPVQRLAFEMRRLRADAGGPSYREMARRVEVGASTLSHAAGGERLPTLPVLLAYVRACEADLEEWELRWRQAAYEVAAIPVVDEEAQPPYRGLKRFETGDRDLYFGRDALITELAAAVQAHRLVGVVGASGSGKSSLLRAGLIPALQTGQPTEQQLAAIRIFAPGSRPHSTHATVMEPSQEAGDTVVLIDQFEELFTLCTDPAERSDFLDLLMTARNPDSRLRVVIAVRADLFGRCAEHHQLADALRHATLVVGPMSPAELREAIVRPAAAAGLIVERTLTARIVREVAEEPGGLPLMSHALLETWRRRRGRALTEEMYDAAGGFQGAIAATAEQIYSGMSSIEARTARWILLRLITPGDGAQDTRRPVGFAELEISSPVVRRVLDLLAEARLLALSDDTVDLAHEALITGWPRYHSWIEEERDRLRTHRLLTDAAAAWRDLDRDPGALYRGIRLAAVEDAFGSDSRDGLTALENDFICVSVAARDRELRAGICTARRLRALTATLSVLLAFAVIISLVAWDQTGISRQSQRGAVAARQLAVSRQLAAQSAALMHTDPDLAALLAIQAYRSSPTVEATDSLYDAAAYPLRRRIAGDIGPVNSAAFSPDGRMFATGSRDGTVGLWDMTTHHFWHILAGISTPVASLAFSRDSHTLLVSRNNGNVDLWNLTDDRFRTKVTSPLWEGVSAFSADGRTLATAGNDDQVHLWDTSSGQLRATVRGSGIRSLALSPDGRVLAAGGYGCIQLWHFGASSVPKCLESRDPNVDSLAFSPDGSILAAGGDDHAVQLWNTRTGRARSTLNGRTGSVEALAFSPDGQTLATGSDDETARLWDTRTGRARSTLNGHTGSVGALAFSPDSRTLVTGGTTVRLWDAKAGQARSTLAHAGGERGMAFGSNSHTLIIMGEEGAPQIWNIAARTHRTLPSAFPVMAVSRDGRTFAADIVGATKVWDVTTGRLRATLPAIHGPTAMAFGPNDHTLATGGEDGVLRLWDTASGHTLSTIPGRAEAVQSLVFSPDGETVAASSATGNVVLWNINTRRLRASLHANVVVPGTADPSARPVSLAFSPDSRTVAIGSTDGTTRLWDVATGHVRATLSANTTPIASVAFSPDSRTVAIGSTDGTTRLWDVATGHVRATLSANTTPIASVAFSPDSRTVATSSTNGTIRLWDVALPNPAQSIDKICSAVRRDLTTHERSVYLTGQPQRPTCSA